MRHPSCGRYPRTGVMSMTTETTADADTVGVGRGGRMSRQRKREAAMPAIMLRLDWDAARVRAAARTATDGEQVRQLLAIAAVYDGNRRSEAACRGDGLA